MSLTEPTNQPSVFKIPNNVSGMLPIVSSFYTAQMNSLMGHHPLQGQILKDVHNIVNTTYILSIVFKFSLSFLVCGGIDEVIFFSFFFFTLE